MPQAARRLIASAAMLLAIATILGALSAHLWRTQLSATQFATLQTAIHYQFFHSLGLLVVGVLAATHGSRLLHGSGVLLAGGVVLFSGSLYALLCGAPHWLGVLTPLGGLCLIAGWLLLAGALLHSPPQAAS